MRYEKGRKEATRRQIIEVATERFKDDGIAASGLAGIMSDAGLTNGAFYPHFQSKAELVRECVATALEDQTNRLQDILSRGGPEAVIDAYLSAEHRDNPRSGCPSAALLAEIAREPVETRRMFAERLLSMLRKMSSALPPQASNSEGALLGVYATLVGALQLARAITGTELSDRVLTAGANAARAILQSHHDKE
jgi:TetR/AcrR family transcriptional repressor of nem operon